jgi:two-component system, LytTR family, sensor histidine kinase AlgZ
VHPVLARRGTTFGYAVVWIAVGVTLTQLEGLSLLMAALLAVPLLLLYGFICLTPWYLCRLMPIRPDTALRVVPMQVLAGLVSASLWLLIGHAWVTLLSSTSVGPELRPAWSRIQPLLFTLAVVVFLLSSAVHYLMVAVDQSRAAETRALRHQMLAAQAELRALRAQITPHFLFNSLNSISALTSSDPAGARRMCLLLGDFLRGTLQVGSLDRIPLAQELALVDQFLAIEQVRFGARLRVERSVDEDTLACGVPPLILQPLAENAIRHGLGQLVDGGTVRIGAHLLEGRLIMAIENPVEGRGRRSGGSGLGLENVRRRLEAAYGREADMASDARDGIFRVVVSLPRLLMEKAS